MTDFTRRSKTVVRMVTTSAKILTCSLLACLLTFTPTAGLLGGGCILSTVDASLSSRFIPEPIAYKPAPPKGPIVGLHVALEDEKTLRVNWMNPVPPSAGSFSPQCLYGPKPANLSLVAAGFHYSYTAGMFNSTLNSAYLDLTLIPCTSPTSPAQSTCTRLLYYQCGEKAFGWSKVYELHVQDEAVPESPGPQIAVVGDMGTPHGQNTIDSIASRIVSVSGSRNSGAGVEMLLHAGDITYADHFNNKENNNSWVWVDYMDKLQAVAARVPYMTAPGNHEGEFSFAAYLNWLPMPTKASGSGSPFWYSFDYLGVHVVAFSTEHDFRPNSTQHQWITQDLKRANENRARVPWVAVIGHRPLYCSSVLCRERCHDEAATYRSYLEDLLYQQKVDVVLVGHIHHYERSYPVYRSQPTQENYINPAAPVHIVNGGAGNPEVNDPTYESSVPWRASDEMTFRNGFLLMTPSRDKLAVQYVMSNTNDVVDSFTIVRT